jgi:hypothetical protein
MLVVMVLVVLTVVLLAVAAAVPEVLAIQDKHQVVRHLQIWVHVVV